MGMRARCRNGQREKEMKESRGERRWWFQTGRGPNPPEERSWQGGDTAFPDYSLGPVCWDPSPCRQVAAFRTCLKPPAFDLPTQPRFAVPLR